VALQIGAGLVRGAAGRASGADAKLLRDLAKQLEASTEADPSLQRLIDHEIAPIMERWPDDRYSTRYGRSSRSSSTPSRAFSRPGTRCSPAPRRASPAGTATFADAERRLSHIQSMGFDVVYLPPIHPIGTTNRQGKNNAVIAQPGEPGARGRSAHVTGPYRRPSELGTIEDFRRFVAAARSRGLEVALDIAFQASPDHPWVEEHPSWFLLRPDGKVQYAENPPRNTRTSIPSTSRATTGRSCGKD